ncbi:MAG: hypothetical protein KDN18_25505, partial [Verrucomicrobiae bacterium]|nr:hypothetical protein [Verrucomicrobiae bacterium]
MNDSQKPVTLPDLQRWLSSNGQDDAWWLSVGDDAVDEIMTLSEIEDYVRLAGHPTCYVLHSSEFEADHQAWMRLDFSPHSSDKLPHSPVSVESDVTVYEEPRFNNERSRIRMISRRLTGSLILLTPLLASLLIYSKFSEEALDKESSPMLFKILATTILATSALVWIDASLGTPPLKSNGKRKGSKPAEWAALTAMFWIIGFPAYCAQRSTADRELNFISSIAVILALFFSVSTMNISRGQLTAFFDYITKYGENPEPSSNDKTAAVKVPVLGTEDEPIKPSVAPRSVAEGVAPARPSENALSSEESSVAP